MLPPPRISEPWEQAILASTESEISHTVKYRSICLFRAIPSSLKNFKVRRPGALRSST